jgi:hypothetical protein
VPEELLIADPVIKGLAGSSGGSRDLGSFSMGELELGYEPPVIFGQMLWTSLCCVGWWDSQESLHKIIGVRDVLCISN